MNAQTAARQTSALQTPSLPDAKPETIGLSSARLQRMSDAFKREVDKGTLPGATVWWHGAARSAGLMRSGGRARQRRRRWHMTASSASSR